jgi:hypothetical protein
MISRCYALHSSLDMNIVIHSSVPSWPLRPLRHYRDLVSDSAEAAGPTMEALRAPSSTHGWAPRAGSRRRERVIFVYRFGSEDAPPIHMRLNVGINSREHFSVHGFVHVPGRGVIAVRGRDPQSRPTSSTSFWGQAPRLVSAAQEPRISSTWRSPSIIPGRIPPPSCPPSPPTQPGPCSRPIGSGTTQRWPKK